MILCKMKVGCNMLFHFVADSSLIENDTVSIVIQSTEEKKVLSSPLVITSETERHFPYKQSNN